MEHTDNAGTRRNSTVDQEAIVLKRLEEYTSLVARLQGLKFPGGGQPMIHGALEGATQNLTVEIMRTLGIEPAFVNLGTLHFDRHNSVSDSHTEGFG